jgi:hypothetical protein
MGNEAASEKQGDAVQRSLFEEQGPLEEGKHLLPASADGQPQSKKAGKRRPVREDVRAIQDLLWKEALSALRDVEQFKDEAGFHEHLRQQLPQNSLETRTRYAQTLLRWFFPDGVKGLAASVWANYHDPSLSEEVLRFLYLRAEPLVAAGVSEALLPIAEGALIPPSYLTNFFRQRFGEETPDKSIKRAKSNLRKLGFLVREKGDRDTLRAMAPSGTGFLVLLHYVFAKEEARGVEFRTLAGDPFWMFLGFKTEDQLRGILKESVNKGLIAKYVVADRIESISFRFTFAEFVAKRRKL